MRWASGFLIAALWALSACETSAPKKFGDIDQARILAADSLPENWLTSGRDFGKTHYSPLDQINKSTVARLGFAWSFDTGTNRVLEATPIVVDGVMYASGPLGRVWALDVLTGKEIWSFTPDVDGQINRKTCCDQANRGVAVWKGKVYVASLDGVLYALDARSGGVLWHTDTITDHARGYSITGAPEIAKNVVIIGNAGDELDVRGYVTAYDLETGTKVWRFFSVPGIGPAEHPELIEARKTWGPDARFDMGGGGAPWDAIHYDPTTNLVFVGTGNAGPYARTVRDPRSAKYKGGDNLYVCSILAIDPDTGRLVWHHQQTPADQYDFTATQPMILADLKINGAVRQVLMQAPKNGFFYIYDRRTGEVLSAEKYARVTWADHVDLKTGRAIENPKLADYSDGPKFVSPALFGAHNWPPMAFSLKTQLVYIPVVEAGAILYSVKTAPLYRPGMFNMAARAAFSEMIARAPEKLPQEVRAALPKIVPDKSVLEEKSYLRAWDPVKGKTAWQVPTMNRNGAGVLATGGGLVFQGSADGHLRVFDDATGALLKEIDTGTAMRAAPLTYKIGGVQYVSVMAAWGGGGWGQTAPGNAQFKYGNAGRILTYRLDGGETPKPALLGDLGPIPSPPDPRSLGLDASPQTIAKGGMLFGMNCAICHSNTDGMMAPNLRRMSEDTHGAFKEIVLDGALKQSGMPGWRDVLSDKDSDAIQGYLISLAAQTAR